MKEGGGKVTTGRGVMGGQGGGGEGSGIVTGISASLRSYTQIKEHE